MYAYLKENIAAIDKIHVEKWFLRVCTCVRVGVCVFFCAQIVRMKMNERQECRLRNIKEHETILINKNVPMFFFYILNEIYCWFCTFCVRAMQFSFFFFISFYFTLHLSLFFL